MTSVPPPKRCYVTLFVSYIVCFYKGRAMRYCYFVLIDAQDAQSNILFFDAIKSNILRMEFIINSCQPVA